MDIHSLKVIEGGMPFEVSEDVTMEGTLASAPAVERRRYPRASQPVRVQGSAGPWYRRRRLEGVATNWSETGLAMQLRGRCRIVPGTLVRLRFWAPGGPKASGGFCAVQGTVVWIRCAPRDARWHMGIRLSALMQESLQMAGWTWQRPAIVVCALGLLGGIGVLKAANVIWFWYDPMFQVYSIIVGLFIFSRAGLALFYRTPRDRGFFPSVSVIIAAKNEETRIAQTVQRCFQSHYPAQLLEVLVVDDGSTDDTWARLKDLLPCYPDLKLFRFPTNRGKRHAMALGAEEARGDILVYVDSDSFVEPEGIYRLVQAFADSTIGAVAGHVKVIIDPANIISKMEYVRYFISHRIMKSAESVFGCVTCCPGAFSAYRRSAVMPNLQPWLNQTFLGNPATFGDDRSLTNFILRSFRVIFSDAAHCWTNVPESWSKYFRQQLRWKKSWSRETLIASTIMYRKPPLAALSYYVGILLTVMAPVMVIRNMLVLPLFYSFSCLPYLLGLVLTYLFFCCVCLYSTRSKYWAYGVAFAGLYIGVLCWQNYYAMATVSRNHWGTR